MDSAYLLKEAVNCGAEVKAYFVKSQFQPDFELEDAVRLAEELGAEMKVISCDVLADSVICENSGDRCYYCKNRIFRDIFTSGERRWIRNGYRRHQCFRRCRGQTGNAGACRDAGAFTSSALRHYQGGGQSALQRGGGCLPGTNRLMPALPPEFPQGEMITGEKLRRIELAEKALSSMGFFGFSHQTLS